MNNTSIFGLIAIICAVLVIYDVWVKQKSMNTGEKILWTISALLFNILTAIIYYLFKKM